MQIHEMTLEECRNFLEQSCLARLSCEMEGQPYVVPVYLAYNGSYLFGFATMGYKIDCMRNNPLVCVEIDDIKAADQWISVVVSGTYEELPDTPEYEVARERAYELLRKRAMWWEPAAVQVEHRDYPSSFTPIFYRIAIDRMTGHRATPDPARVQRAPQSTVTNWLSRSLRRMFH